MASLALSLLVVPLPADAGTYSASYSGGTYNGLGGQFGAPGTYNDTGGSGSGSEGGGGASCQGAISATLTWQPAYTGEPAPPSSSVIVTETATASSQTLASGSDTAKCDDGMGQPGSQQSAPGAAQYSSGPNPQVTGYFAQVSAKDTRYTAGGGSSISLSATPTGSVTDTGAESSAASVHYTVSASPVTITLSGTTPDSSGNPNILVGQQCSASVNGIPTGTGWSATYSWSVSGTTFESWSPTTPQIGTTPANSQASYYNPGPIPATNSTSWYWNDLSSTPETVSCTVTVTPPTGEGSSFTLTVSAPQPVSVQVPGWNAYGIGGYMEVDTSAPGQSGYALFAGPSPTPGQFGGINLTASSMTPPLFGKGSLELVQLVTPELSYVIYSTGTTRNDPENGMYGLDTQYPKQGPSYSEGTYPYFTDDLPSIGLSNSIASATMQHSFTDYLMYQPPGSSQWVPLGTFTWSTNGYAHVPFTDNWTDYLGFNGSNAAGTVSPSSQTNFTSGNSFPSWTRIDVFPSF